MSGTPETGGEQPCLTQAVSGREFSLLGAEPHSAAEVVCAEFMGARWVRDDDGYGWTLLYPGVRTSPLLARTDCDGIVCYWGGRPNPFENESDAAALRTMEGIRKSTPRFATVVAALENHANEPRYAGVVAPIVEALYRQQDEMNQRDTE